MLNRQVPPVCRNGVTAVSTNLANVTFQALRERLGPEGCRHPINDLNQMREIDRFLPMKDIVMRNLSQAPRLPNLRLDTELSKVEQWLRQVIAGEKIEMRFSGYEYR